MHRHLVTRALLLPVAVLVAMAAAAPPAEAQFEFTGSWTILATEDLSNDSVPVDYMGLPLNDEARDRALTYSESQLGMLDHQCEGWPAPYIMTGPFGLKVFSTSEPIKGNVVSYTIAAWGDKMPLIIWMDGRPHPSKFAARTRTGFTTGHWEGNTLVTSTTHMKAGNLRKTGPPLSDEATMTIRFYRHGDILSLLAVIEDPIYLTEPLLWSRSYRASRDEAGLLVPACVPAFEGTPPGDGVPHFSPATNPYIDELTKKYGVPRAAALGFAETLYPEYRKKMRREHDGTATRANR
jgi:hypothetical protein